MVQHQFSSGSCLIVFSLSVWYFFMRGNIAHLLSLSQHFFAKVITWFLLKPSIAWTVHIVSNSSAFIFACPFECFLQTEPCFHIIAFHFISFSCHFISFHFISLHFIFHVISFRFIWSVSYAWKLFGLVKYRFLCFGKGEKVVVVVVMMMLVAFLSPIQILQHKRSLLESMYRCGEKRPVYQGT